MHEQLALAAAATMLPQIDALPRAETELAVYRGNGKRGGGKRCLDMRRHVVGSFGIVPVERVALGDEAIEPALEILFRCRIGILLDKQACGRMADEERAQALLDSRLPHERRNLLRHLVQALSRRAHAELLNHRRALRAPPRPGASCLPETPGTRRRRSRCSRYPWRGRTC